MTETEVAMVTCAEADLVVSACDVTFTTTTAGLGTIAGAVYKPAALICPQLEPVQPVPEMPQDTEAFALPVTCAENCTEPDGASLAEVGEIVILTAGTTVTVALADLLESAADVAISEKNGGLGGAGGAVNSPEELTVPQTLPAQPIPEIFQVTPVFDEPVTTALNFCVPPAPT